MQTHYTKATIDSNGSLHIDALPFSAGEMVEVIIMSPTTQAKNGSHYPLRNTPVTYIKPFEPSCEADWESTQ
jgi:hypothetical protein